MHNKRAPIVNRNRRNSFQGWSDQFLHSRLGLARGVAAGALWLFVGIDYMLHADSITELVLLRAVAVGLLLATTVFDRTDLIRKRPYIAALMIMWSLTFPLSHMTVYIGGFTSDYYLGVVMVHVGAAALLPWRWQLHVLAQAGSLAYWFSINAVSFGLTGFYPLGMEALLVQFTFYLLVDLSIFFYVYRFREHYAARQELEETLELLTSRGQNKNEYFNAKSEALRSDMRTVENRLYDAMVQAGKDNLKQYQSLLKPAEKAYKRIQSLLSDVLDLYALEVQELELKKTGVYLGDILKQVQELYSDKDTTKLQVNNEIGETVALKTDPQKLKQLIINVLDYLYSVSKTNRVNILIPDNTENRTDIYIELSTDSVGMTPEERIRLFMPYNLSPGSESGLGLIIARQLARRLGGDLTAGGRFGESASFKIRIPQYGPKVDE